MRSATEMLASSMNSSTSKLVSNSSLTSTSTGPDCSEDSRWILTSGDARLRAPAAIRFARSLIAIELRRRIPSVNGSVSDASSLRRCAAS